jgi:hypothetical protein
MSTLIIPAQPRLPDPPANRFAEQTIAAFKALDRRVAALQGRADAPAHYLGYGDSNVVAGSATWADLDTAIGTILDVSSGGISRSGSAFTFEAVGLYRIDVSVNVVSSTTGTRDYGLRLHDLIENEIYMAQNTPLGATGIAARGRMRASQLINVYTPGVVLNLQYVVSTGTGTFSPVTLNGWPMDNANISMERI